MARAEPEGGLMPNLGRWLRRRFIALHRWLQPLTAFETDDLPDQLKANQVYLVGEEGIWWSAAMVCPCGCRAKIQLSLVEKDRPRWRALVEPTGVITLHPSVWRTKGCKSHFSVIHGRIVWARET